LEGHETLSQIRRCPYLRPIPFYAESPAARGSSLSTGKSTGTAQAITSGVDGPQGWPLYLDRYAALVKDGR